MTKIIGIAQLVDNELEGRTNTYSFRKNPSQVTTQGIWFDLALSPGNPVPKYWFGTPLAATAINQSGDGGLYHGASVFPGKKYLRKTTVTVNNVVTALPMNLTLCDYIMYYPLIDEGTTDEQFMTNTTTLPRYTDGKGVQVMAILVAAGLGGQSFFINYTNSEGVAGRISQTVLENTATSLGVVKTSALNANANTCLFIPLQSGDSGVRSIESVTMLGPDVGLFSLVLVKPLANTQIVGIDAPVEKDYLLESGILPEIFPDAFLNFLCIPRGALNGTGILIDMKVVWTT